MIAYSRRSLLSHEDRIVRKNAFKEMANIGCDLFIEHQTDEFPFNESIANRYREETHVIPTLVLFGNIYAS